MKDYVKRFNQIVLEVEDPNDEVVVMAMMEGLCSRLLFDSLSKNVPSSPPSKGGEEGMITREKSLIHDE